MNFTEPSDIYQSPFSIHSVKNYIYSTLTKGVGVVFHQRSLETISQMRNRHLLLLDLLILLLTPVLSLSLHFGLWGWSVEHFQMIGLYTLVTVLVKLVIFYWFELYNRCWRYSDSTDIAMVVLAVLAATFFLTGIFAAVNSFSSMFYLISVPAVPLIDGMLTGIAIVGLHLFPHLSHTWLRQHQVTPKSQNVLIVGAGVAGTTAHGEIRNNPSLGMAVAAFVDDDVTKIGAQVQGVPVAGSCQEIAAVVHKYGIQRIIVAMPSVPSIRRQQIMELCNNTCAETCGMPGVYELLAGYKTINPVTEIDVKRLLNRAPIQIEQTEVATALRGKTVLVTGAGGSIGSELCRQIGRLNPGKLILLGHGENSIFEIGLELRVAFPDLTMHQVIADVRHRERIQQIVKEYRPDFIYHAAAHKHVPLMQADVSEAVMNNVEGTRNVIQAAEVARVERVVLISTDKAINPTSIMGATKRIAELLVQSASRRTGAAYMSVRFGNVLGSRGSVIPLFQRQIAVGGPVTITHPEMTRYFMTIPEAVQLVLQASVLGQGGEVFVLDMGEPVRILDLATRLIEMSGLRKGKDVDVICSGIRPGEKLHEQLFQTSEQFRRTKHEKIFVAMDTDNQSQDVEDEVAQLIGLTKTLRDQDVVNQIRKIIPQYQSGLLSQTSDVSNPKRDKIAETVVSYRSPEKFHPKSQPIEMEQSFSG